MSSVSHATAGSPSLEPAALPQSRGRIGIGLALAVAIAALAYSLRAIPALAIMSPVILAVLLGALFHNLVGTPAAARPGVGIAARAILRLAIILLGLQLTAAQVAEVGAAGAIILLVTVGATFLFTRLLGRLLGVDRKLTTLIAAGTSVCGASAVMATNTVVRASDENVVYAVSCVTVFGSLSMLLFPLLPLVVGFDPLSYGLWTGASIHEVAQVAAAAFQFGDDAGQVGTVAKLFRVLLLAPLVLGLGWVAVRRNGRQAGAAAAPVAMPWFVLGFVALVVVNSVLAIDPLVKGWTAHLAAFLLTVALAGLGLQTDVRKLMAKGVRPLLLGAAAWLFISAGSLALVILLF